MELKGKFWENYTSRFIEESKNSEYWKERGLALETSSVGEMIKALNNWKSNIERNGIDINEFPVFVEFEGKKYSVNTFIQSSRYCSFEVSSADDITFVAPDSRPEVGEYWSSRGPSDSDCSGFVVSKKAGERLRRLVRYVLESDDTESWLDFREHEPNWIQFKFSAKEFDVNKLDLMAKENNGIINESILRECKL